MLTGQFVRFCIAGAALNAFLYLGYLVLTGLGLTPTTAMTALYTVGVGCSFWLHQGWTFREMAARRGAYLRFGLVYLIGYGLNYGGLRLFVGALGYPHRIVQAVMVVVVAASVFALLRAVVFPARSGSQLPAD